MIDKFIKSSLLADLQYILIWGYIENLEGTILWYQTGHNLLCAFSYVCNAGHANPQLSSSSPSPEPASPSTYRISPTMSAWVDSFEVPWNKMRPSLRRAVAAGERPSPDDRRHLMRITIDAMREHSLNPTRKECVIVAKAITQKYPNSFLDKTEEGELIGCGYFSVVNQLKTRVEYVNRGNTLSRLRKPKRTQRDDENGDDEQPAVATCVRDSYGCVRWQPEDYPDGETSASLEEKKLEMLDIFSQEGLKGAERGRVEDLMAITYAKQREYINTNPSTSILDVGKEWPFLFTQKFLLSHFTTLTNVELHRRLNEDLDKKGKRLLDFFSCQITRWRKEVRAVLKEALKDGREGTDGLAAMLVMLAHFKEQEDSLFLLADVSCFSVFNNYLSYLLLPESFSLIRVKHFTPPKLYCKLLSLQWHLVLGFK